VILGDEPTPSFPSRLPKYRWAAITRSVPIELAIFPWLGLALALQLKVVAVYLFTALIGIVVPVATYWLAGHLAMDLNSKDIFVRRFLGSVRVAICDVDRISILDPWYGSGKIGATVVLRIHLKRGKIYSIWSWCWITDGGTKRKLAHERYCISEIRRLHAYLELQTQRQIALEMNDTIRRKLGCHRACD
jgi:hypothetical protein